MQAMKGVAEFYGFKTTTPWKDLSRAHQELILYGSGDDIIPITYHSKSESTWKSNKPFEGVIPSLARRMIETDSNSAREALAKYQRSSQAY